jgi:hypothetical protein
MIIIILGWFFSMVIATTIYSLWHRFEEDFFSR